VLAGAKSRKQPVSKIKIQILLENHKKITMDTKELQNLD